jgi:hypothetical protein
VPANSDDEYKHLESHYASLSNEELEVLVQSAESLTQNAHEALQAELDRRNISVRLTALPDDAEQLRISTDSAPDPDTLVVLEVFRDLPPALIAKGAVESAGITCFLIDATTVRMDWFWSNAIGGIKLVVAKEDFEAARGVLAEAWEAPMEIEGVGSVPQPRCPRCESADVSYKAPNRRASYTTVAIGLPVLISYPAWNCHNCGVTWEMTEGGAPLE